MAHSDHSGHSHAPDLRGGRLHRAFAIGVALNVIFVAVEAFWGWRAGSLALLADAGHNLSDVLSLLLAWGASLLAGRPASLRRTYGFRRATILASLTSAVLLLIAIGAIAWEAIQRIGSPQALDGWTVVTVATVGIGINAVTAALFAKGSKEDLNVRGAYLHMAADAAVSLGVVIAGVGILLTGWLWLDPAVSLLVVAVILVGTWGLLRDSLNLAVDAVPREIDPSAVKTYLLAQPGVEALHDLHIWAMSTTESALTVHLVMPDQSANDLFLQDLSHRLQHDFRIDHTTVQVERGTLDHPCPQADAACA